MRHIKRSLTLLLIAAMILSSINVIYADTATTKFTDINTSWAKQNIINVFNKGLMNGVNPEGTLFKPLDKVTNYSALISIARMTKAKEKYDLAALETKYKTAVLDKYNVPAYARPEVAYCIEVGILKAEDISAFAQKPNITKQIVSGYLAKAFGVTYDPEKPIVFLGYSDSMFIIKENKPYIKYLIDIGVLSSKGDAKGNFNPDEQISRETYAKMLDVASDKYNEVKPTTPTTPTTPVTPTTPTAPVTPTTPTTPTTPVPTPTTPTPTIPAPTVIQPDYAGTVDQIILEYGVIVVQIKGANNVVTKKNFTVSDDIKCTIDGVESSYYWKVKTGDKVSLYLNKDGKIAKLIVESKYKKYTGTIESILVTDKLELSINIDNVGSRKFYLTTATKIIKNKSSVKYDSLKAGDKVQLTADDTEVTEINADSTVATDNGIIESILYTRTAAPKITMIGFDGKNKEYFIRKDLQTNNILINDKGSYVYDLRPGMQVKVELENDEIIKLTTIRIETNNKVDGTIKFINKTFKIIVLATYGLDGKEITKEISIENAEIANASLTRLTIDQLKEGDKVTVFAVEDAGKLKASSIILNN